MGTKDRAAAINGYKAATRAETSGRTPTPGGGGGESATIGSGAAPVSSSGEDAEPAALAAKCDSWIWDYAWDIVASVQTDFDSWGELTRIP